MNERRKSVVERYKKAYDLFKNDLNIGWQRALRENGLTKHYPHLNLECWKNNKKLDDRISDFIGMVNRCLHKDPDFLLYCKRVAIVNDLVPTGCMIEYASEEEKEMRSAYDLTFFSDEEVIEQVRKRGLYIGADGKYHKKQIIEKVIDIE